MCLVVFVLVFHEGQRSSNINSYILRSKQGLTMDTLFGRKRSRPRQSSVSGQDLSERSVPYDKLAMPSRSPVPVATFNQGIRGISAPSSNPALSHSGNELNKYAMQRNKAEREKGYELHVNGRPGSPSTSISTADSSTLSDESAPSSKHAPHTPSSSRVRLNEAPTPSGVQSPDFGHFSNGSTNNFTIRPTSSVTTHSETSRTSKYASSMSSSEAHHSVFYHSRSNHTSDTFHFPRPETDEEIEELFENVIRTRTQGELPNLLIEQKWHMVYNDEHLRWKEERAREEQSRRQKETGQPAQIMSESPEWYIQKFLDKTITPKQASGLLVSLRSKQMRYDQR